MSNGQTAQEPNRDRLALDAIRALKARGISSPILDQLEDSLTKEVASTLPTSPEQPGLLKTILGDWGQFKEQLKPTGAEAIGARAGVKAGEVGLNAIQSIADLLAWAASNASATGGPAPRVLPEAAEITSPNLQRLLGADFEQTKQYIDETFGVSGTGQLVADIAGEMIGLAAVGGAAGGAAGAVATKIGMASGSAQGIMLDLAAGLFVGGAAGAAAEAARTYPISEETSWWDPPGEIAKWLMNHGVVEDERVALALGGAALGVGVDAIVQSFRQGVRFYRTNLSRKAGFLKALDEMMKDRRARAWLEQQNGITRENIAKDAGRFLERTLEQPPRVVIPRELADKVGEQMTREKIAIQSFAPDPQFAGWRASPGMSPNTALTRAPNRSAFIDVLEILTDDDVARINVALTEAGIPFRHVEGAQGNAGTWANIPGDRGVEAKRVIDETLMRIPPHGWTPLADPEVAILNRVIDGNPEGVVVLRGVSQDAVDRVNASLGREGANFNVAPAAMPDGSVNVVVGPPTPRMRNFERYPDGSFGLRVGVGRHNVLITGDESPAISRGPTTLRVDITGAQPDAIGPVGMRQIMEMLRQKFPRAESIEGFRVSGVRSAEPANVSVPMRHPKKIHRAYALESRDVITPQVSATRLQRWPPTQAPTNNAMLTYNMKGEAGIRGAERWRVGFFTDEGRAIGHLRYDTLPEALDAMERLGYKVVNTVGDLEPPDAFAIQKQLTRTGAFEGQLGVLRGGHAVEVISRNPTLGKVTYRNPVSGKVEEVSDQLINLMDTSIHGYESLDDLVLAHVPKDEAKAFRQLKSALIKGDVQSFPDKELLELEELAKSKGVWWRGAENGQLHAVNTVSGDVVKFENVEAARWWLHNYRPMLPEVGSGADPWTLGMGMGFLGGGGPPLRFGEVIPLQPDDFWNTFRPVPEASKDFRGLGVFSKIRMPTRRALLEIEKFTRIPVWSKGFEPLQKAWVKTRNFEYGWKSGKGPAANMPPPGVKSLDEIRRMAGHKPGVGNRITDWLEVELDDVVRGRVEDGMSAREIRAAKELRKWYDALGQRFQIDPLRWIREYAPHYRKYADTYGNAVVKMWRETKQGMPLPKELVFVSDMARWGTMHLYEKNAFTAAGRYLRGGANNRYLDAAWQNAMNIKKSIGNAAIERPLASYLEALRGVEFPEQVSALQATVRGILGKMPGMKGSMSVDEFAKVADDFTLALLGMSYQATMGFRVGLAIRNLTQLLQTSWTLFGTHPGLFMKAVKMALTPEGRESAALAGVVTKRSMPVYAGEEILDKIPSWMTKMSESSLKLYTGADEANRTITFLAARMQAEDAIRMFAAKAATAKNPQTLLKLRQKLFLDSGAAFYDLPVGNKFLQILKRDAAGAAEYLGKQAADVTQFLYGRGNQQRWMRAIPGRFVGQFGTWPSWYIDYVISTSKNLNQNMGTAAMLRFWTRLGIANAAVILAGREVLKIDIGRWAAYNSLFYTGGPGTEIISGLVSSVRGAGTLATLDDAETTYGKARLKSGLETLRRVGRAFVPGHYAVRDYWRMLQELDKGNYREAIARGLGTTTTTDYQEKQQSDAMDIFLEGHGFTDPYEEMQERVRQFQEDRANQRRNDFVPDTTGGGVQ